MIEIDLEQVRGTLRNHAEDLKDQLSCTERAIDMLGRVGVPVLFAPDESVPA